MQLTIFKEKNFVARLMILLMSGVVFLSILSGAAKGAGSSSALTFVGEQYFENRRDGSTWTKSRSKRFKASSDVQQYLSDLNKGQFNDWRLPTREELYNLFVIFDFKDNGDVKVRIEGNYWLADNWGKMSVGAWGIGDGCGPERNFSSGKKGYVRAIRP